jgi:hypothetical protein
MIYLYLEMNSDEAAITIIVPWNGFEIILSGV